ncbi:MAG: Flp pilus assembly complex ATPase component TadA [Candidatus Latescibacteria bacterium]|nr:Flp pilus assembly complex ATPase component TadA [Candidatus Latescibacterota bacterium]
MRVIGLDVTKIAPEVVQLIPERIARALFLVAVAKHEDTLTVAMVNPSDQAAMDQVRQETGLEVMTLHADRQDILDAIQIGYGEVVPDVKRVEHQSTANEVSAALIDDEAPDQDSTKQSEVGADTALDLPELDSDHTTPTEVLQQMLADAITQNATVIFIEPQTQNAVIRFRGGGPVRPYGRITKRTCSTVIAKVRELAQSQSEDSLSPSQGRFRVRIQKMVRTFSYHSISTIHGESTVVRLHSPFERAAGISDLGFGEKARQLFLQTVEQPDGLILVTGPPEHGQMTTLYAALQHLNAPNRKIVTLEDPVTSAVDGFTQVSIRFDMGQSYASALHDLRHHDPDIILIEDTSDAEAASIATQIAATGRKVLGIVASPDAISCVDHLRSQGVPPFLISRALRLVLTQYKLKRLCQQCKRESDPSTEMFDQVQNYVQEEVSVSSFTSPGCDACSNTGYRGFSMVYEFLPIGEPLKDAILGESDPASLRQIAYPRGRSSLFDAGLNRVNRGVITLEDFLTTIMHR